MGSELKQGKGKGEIGRRNPDDGAFGTMSGSGHSAFKAESSGGGNRKAEEAPDYKSQITNPPAGEAGKFKI